MRTKKLWIAVATCALLALAISAVKAGADQAPELPEEMARPLAWLVQQIDESYVEEVDHQELAVGAVQGMLSKLDRYSSYMPPEMVEEFEADTKGEFGGLGIEIRFDAIQKAVVVEQTIPGTPAFKEGVLPGDLIVEIQEDPASEVIKVADFEDVYDAVQVLRGEPGDEVTITVLRGKKRREKTIRITRGIIHIPGVRGVELVGPDQNVGYIYLAYFHEHTVEDLVNAIGDLRAQGADGLILDLRFNPGGLLTSALQLANLFLDDKLIVRVEGRTGLVQYLRSESGDAYEGVPLVLLVNGYSASASEIVAAALSEHGRARVVGSPTHGKASVQQIFHMHPSSRKDAIKMTIANYYTPEGTLIAEKGVEPDVPVKLEEEEIARLVKELSRRMAYPTPDESEAEEAPAAEPEDEAQEQEEPEEEFQDKQLERALQIMAELLEKEQKEPARAARGRLSPPIPAT